MRSHNTVGEVGRSKQEAAAASQCCDRKGMQLGGREKGSSDSVSSDSKYLYQNLKVLTSNHLDNYSISKGIIVSLFPSGFYGEGLRAYLYPMVRVMSQNLLATFFF